MHGTQYLSNTLAGYSKRMEGVEVTFCHDRDCGVLGEAD